MVDNHYMYEQHTHLEILLIVLRPEGLHDLGCKEACVQDYFVNLGLTGNRTGVHLILFFDIGME